ncbi:MAG: lysine biosynthesis protein LysW [Candidatus Burarchaeum sp.]|nr:lysine biosynthesis protein LysW [Candidatus Burarchaeum sp.]MDO8339641.1 lysine biosynthesis protein LysW [Candidatus Burarchaeum sp.]
MNATCPECAGEVKLKETCELGEIVPCPDCGSRLEVMGMQPLKLEPAPKLEEDWGE